MGPEGRELSLNHDARGGGEREEDEAGTVPKPWGDRIKGTGDWHGGTHGGTRQCGR